jgi:hypothetical protein
MLNMFLNCIYKFLDNNEGVYENEEKFTSNPQVLARIQTEAKKKTKTERRIH